MSSTGTETIKNWPEASREAAQLVIDQRGEPHEVTESQLIWHKVSPWKRLVASKTYFDHNFPIPHIDSVESVIDYLVPADKFSDLAAFDGSVVVERTAGEVSARCHDEQANLLALNLMHDLVTGQKNVTEARDYYAEEFLRFRRKQSTPYMERLHFLAANTDYESTADPDQSVLTDEDLQAAVEEGKRQH